MLCKTIILSNNKNLGTNAPKGILTLSKEDLLIKGKIRLYNIVALPPKTQIGLYIDENIYTSSLSKKQTHYEFTLTKNIDITKNIYCALLDISTTDKNIILDGGNFNGFYFTDSPFANTIEEDDRDEELEKTINRALLETSTQSIQCDCSNCEYKKYFYEHCNHINSNSSYSVSKPIELQNDNQSPAEQCINPPTPSAEKNNTEDGIIGERQQEVINTLENNLFENLVNKPLCENQNEFFNQVTEIIEDFENLSQLKEVPLKDTISNNEDLSTIPEILASENKIEEMPTVEIPNQEQNDEQKHKMEFLNDIIYQIDELFKKYPEDQILNSIIPNSKFISVNTDNPYVLGVIYENKQLKYIAYGVPASYNSLPPADLGPHYQWLPLNTSDVMSDGYFMIYQNAITGSLVEINFEDE